MKIKILCLLLLCTTITLFSQNDFRLGLTTGVGFGDFRSDRFPEDAKSEAVLVVGISAEKDLNKNVFIRGGITYGKIATTVKNGIVISPNDPFPGPTEFDISITPISLDLGVGYASNGALRFIATGGPFFSYITDSNNLLTEDTDYGLTASLGAEYDLSSTSILRFQVKEELGLADINGSQIDSNKFSTNRLGAYFNFLYSL